MHNSSHSSLLRSMRWIAPLAWLLLAAPTFAATPIWQDRTKLSAADTAALSTTLREYRSLTLNLMALRSQLDNAPDEIAGAAPLQIELPMPDGTMQPFAVYRTEVMAPELAARYPEIRSFVARAVGHNEIQARLDDSPLGFSAMIRAPAGVTMLQPAKLGTASNYISFRREALGVSADPFRCLVGGHDSLTTQSITPAPQTITGATIRTYRLALAATGEYTAYFGGTVTLGLAAVVQAVNRVNGIYLTDFAVKFQLIANNNLLIYTDPATDPYTNNDGVTMLDQNQSTIDSVIGTANYDFGHVFSTGGGGVAAVGVACSAGSKAQGVTGTGSPDGDGFWVDYVAHEMGHQMGSDHTFNTVDGSCAGNREPSQAAEPGSGSTIMAYAGICGPSDLQPHSDAYFHEASLTPIVSTLAGSGSTCGTAVASTNHAPAISAIPSKTIPAQTPFLLTGAATDQDGDALTYAWEENDTGTQSPAEGDALGTNRALFRSYNPTSSPSRMVPELLRVLGHDPTLGIPSGGDISGESWATTTRNLHFRLTVRDNHAGGGATRSADGIVAVTSTAGPFLVTAPTQTAQWATGTSKPVTWNVANTTAAPVSCAAVDVLYSADGGQTFPTVLASAVPNSGATTVTAPATTTTHARIQVRCSNNIFFDISPGDFVIGGDIIFKDGFGVPN
jgi:hypothetical protein